MCGARVIRLVYNISMCNDFNKAPVAQWIERPFPKRKVIGSTPIWRVYLFFYFPVSSKRCGLKFFGMESKLKP